MPGPGDPGEARRHASRLKATMAKVISVPANALPGVLANEICTRFKSFRRGGDLVH